MIIQCVKFKSGYSNDELMKILKERAVEFRKIPGLIQKYYGFENETGELCGIYLWDSQESIDEFRKSELFKTIPTAYDAQGTPRVEFFDILYTLRS